MLVYDDVDAVAFIVETTRLPVETVTTILRAADEYGVGLEIFPPDFLEGVTPDAIRALAPALFPRDRIEARYIVTPLERAFVALRTGMDEDLIALVIHANESYLYKLGIMSPVIMSDTMH
jgi:hypothetical protein